MVGRGAGVGTVGRYIKIILNEAMALGPYSARFRPWGEIVMSLWIHLRSAKSLLPLAALLLLGDVMNSKMCMVTSSNW